MSGIFMKVLMFLLLPILVHGAHPQTNFYCYVCNDCNSRNKPEQELCRDISFEVVAHTPVALGARNSPSGIYVTTERKTLTDIITNVFTTSKYYFNYLVPSIFTGTDTGVQTDPCPTKPMRSTMLITTSQNNVDIETPSTPDIKSFGNIADVLARKSTTPKSRKPPISSDEPAEHSIVSLTLSRPETSTSRMESTATTQIAITTSDNFHHLVLTLTTTTRARKRHKHKFRKPPITSDEPAEHSIVSLTLSWPETSTSRMESTATTQIAITTSHHSNLRTPNAPWLPSIKTKKSKPHHGHHGHHHHRQHNENCKKLPPIMNFTDPDNLYSKYRNLTRELTRKRPRMGIGNFSVTETRVTCKKVRLPPFPSGQFIFHNPPKKHTLPKSATRRLTRRKPGIAPGKTLRNNRLRRQVTQSTIRRAMLRLKHHKRPMARELFHRNEFACYTVQIEGRVQKGCVSLFEIQSPCDLLRSQYRTNSCSICYTSNCNRANFLHHVCLPCLLFSLVFCLCLSQ